MYVREYMVTPAITVTPDTLIDEALKVMHQHNIRRLPVVDRRKLVGLVTRQGLRETTPSVPIPLSIWGTHYQLARMKVRDVMITDIVTVTPDTTIEEATVLVQQRKIGTLPVVDEKGILAGIITGTDLLRLLAQVLGFGKKGVRLHIFGYSGGTGRVHHRQVMEVLSKHSVEILSAFPVKMTDTEREDFIIHLDTEDAGTIVDDLKKLGFEVEVRKH